MADYLNLNTSVKSKLALKRIKQLVQKTNLKPIKKVVDAPTKKTTSEVKKERGVIYIGHLPHGFYEEEMKAYFSQIGKITNIKVVRSKKTGKSKGHAFIEFRHPEVAKIAAESMNNYLMFKRLLKAEYIPPEKQHPLLFKGKKWTAKYYPKLINRTKINKLKNTNVSKLEDIKFARNSIKKISKINKKLQEAGIKYHFEPSDVPDVIKNEKRAHKQKSIKLENIDIKVEIKSESESEDEVKTEEDIKSDNEEEIDSSDDEISFTIPEHLKEFVKIPSKKRNEKATLKVGSKFKKNKTGLVTKKSSKKSANLRNVKNVVDNLQNFVKTGQVVLKTADDLKNKKKQKFQNKK